jgi:hypothetical protein
MHRRAQALGGLQKGEPFELLNESDRVAVGLASEANKPAGPRSVESKVNRLSTAVLNRV